jgi:hypothetical protein
MSANSWSVSTVEGKPGLLITRTPVAPGPFDLETDFFPIGHHSKLEWALRHARANLDYIGIDGKRHPWIPGASFGNCPELADILLSFIDGLLGEDNGGDQEEPR